MVFAIQYLLFGTSVYTGMAVHIGTCSMFFQYVSFVGMKIVDS